MRKKGLLLAIMIILVSSFALFGAAGRPRDGFLSFILTLGFLGLILGVLYLVDYMKILIRRILEGNGEKLVP